MEAAKFVAMRKHLGFTQKQLAQVLLISIKAVRSYEQGWRSVPQNIERQIMLLASIGKSSGKAVRTCWDVRKCPVERRRQCPAYKLSAGHFCWFVNGTICEGKSRENWDDKIRICRKCEMFLVEMPPGPEQKPPKRERSKV